MYEIKTKFGLYNTWLYISFIYVKNACTLLNITYLYNLQGVLYLSLWLYPLHINSFYFLSRQLVKPATHVSELVHNIYQYMSLSPEQATNKHQKMKEEKEVHLTCMLNEAQEAWYVYDCEFVTISLKPDFSTSIFALLDKN